jgi:carboxymethylenebutenolidase
MTHSPDRSRRDFVSQGIGVGFALAVLPAAAWAITTSSDDLEAGPVSIPTDGGPMPGYRAMPKKRKGPLPVVIVVQEIFGIHEYIQDVCRRLARLGYCAVAPSLYFRQGDATKVSDMKVLMDTIVSKVDSERVLTDLDATLKWLDQNKVGDLKRVGITGFCWGGTVVWDYARHNPAIRAGVAWYGKLGEGARSKRKPVEFAKDLRVPVLGLYGGKDSGIPQTDVEQMRAELKQGKSGSEIIVYPEAEHGFHADYRPSYNEKAAMDGWQRLQRWFRGTGVA